ncbi:hypothetical protein [Limisphaera sp. VF-2]|jgi:hypothetical protein|uniref:hypothetical protein n=1 Tax=Limisphaera sp. VF-2 TaxID=3400418 RepID=UPI00185749F5
MHNVGVAIWALVLFVVPLAVLFAVAYFPVLLGAAMLTRRRWLNTADVWTPYASAAGTVLAYIAAGFLDIDRFAFVPQHTIAAWQSAGYFYELTQALLNGLISGLLLVILARFRPNLVRRPWVAKPLVAGLVSFVVFWFWPALVSAVV